MATVKKKAAPKKKATPVKGAWTPPWAKKETTTEKKTGEKYKSKAAMAKHEKGEPKKTKIKEGEIKKFGDGGLQTQMGKIMKSQGQQARKAGLTQKLDGKNLFDMSEMKVEPVRKGATGAQLKAEGLLLKKKGMALKKKGQSMRKGGKVC